MQVAQKVSKDLKLVGVPAALRDEYLIPAIADGKLETSNRFEGGFQIRIKNARGEDIFLDPSDEIVKKINLRPLS